MASKTLKITQSTSKKRPALKSKIKLYLILLLPIFAFSNVEAIEKNSILPSNSKEPVQFSARDVTYNSQDNILEARGKVTAHWQGQTVKADNFRYNTEKDRIFANGNVELTNSDGSIIQTNKTELSGDFKEAVIGKLIVYLPDGALISAKSGKRSKGRYNHLYNATYTACTRCVAEGRRPTWSLSSPKVTHDSQNKYITARNVTLDVYGQPILWLPWIGYPDPTVKRKTGFLIPSFGYDSRLGAFGDIPIFFVINDYSDITLTPFIYEKKNPRIATRYRQRFSGGGFNLNGSFTYDGEVNKEYTEAQDVDNIRWDTNSHFWWQLAPKWFLTSDIRLTSDKRYLEDYDINSEIDKADFLESNITLERRDYDSWLQIQAFYFQTQDQEINQAYIPYVLPEMSFNWQRKKDRFGGNAYFSNNAQSLYRKKNIDISLDTQSSFLADSPRTRHRFTSTAGWAGHWIGAFGEEYSFDASVSALSWVSNGYYVNGTDFSGNETLIRPTISGQFSYPLIQISPNHSFTLEPVVQAVWSPEYKESDYRYIPNEDSQSFELTGNNLFTNNRFSGLDRDEGGLRINYGLRGSVDFANGGYSRFQIGQVWKPFYNNEFDGAKNSGLDSEISDYVTQLELQPTPWLNLSSNGRFDQKDFSVRRLDLSGSFGPRSLKFSGYYTWFDDLESNQKTEEVSVDLSTQLSDQLHLRGYVTYDLENNEDSLPKEARAELLWENECISLGSYYKREWKSDGVTNDSFGIQFTLKTLSSINLDL